MLNRVKALGATLLVSGIIGCGGGSGGGSVTSLPASTSLMTLTPAQKTQLCADTAAYVSRNISDADACKLEGFVGALIGLALEPTISDAQLQDLCNQGVAACMPAAAECTIGDTATCSADATIGDFSACTSDETAAVKNLVKMLPACSALTSAWITANAGAAGMVPASCTALDAKCPDIMM